MIGDCVIDASVGIKLFVEEEHTRVADRLFEQLSADPPARFYVPDLFFVECANVLWKYVRNYGYPAENARQDTADLRKLRLRIIRTADLITPALDLALRYDMTAYDACYSALAQQISLPLITADVILAKKMKGSGIEAHLLKEIDE